MSPPDDVPAGLVARLRRVPAAHHVIGILVALAIIGLARFYGPELETVLSPVVGFGRTDNLYRDADKVCWRLHAEKLRWATEPHYEFYAEPEQGPNIPTGAYLVDEELRPLPDQTMRPHGVGARWTRHYCFDIADRLPAIQRVRVIGHVEHWRHPFWTTVTPVPAILFCPLGHAQDGRC